MLWVSCYGKALIPHEFADSDVYLVPTLVLCGITCPEERQMQAHRLVHANFLLHILQSVLDASGGLLMEQR